MPCPEQRPLNEDRKGIKLLHEEETIKEDNLQSASLGKNWTLLILLAPALIAVSMARPVVFRGTSNDNVLVA